MNWCEKNIRVFLFGDYEFLCSMYGISGACGRHPCLWSPSMLVVAIHACGRHPCLWCHIPSDMLCVPLAERLNQFSLRSLITLKSDYDKFVNNH